MRTSNFVFLRPRLRVLQPIQDLRTSHQWSPRIEFRLLERVIEKRESMVQRVAERRIETRIREREQMVVRLTTGRGRTEDPRVVAAPTPAAALKNMAVPVAAMVSRPPEMKLNRTPEIKEPAAKERSAHGSPRTPAPPPLDVNRLTDQVMRQIDRKLEAHRERMWKK